MYQVLEYNSFSPDPHVSGMLDTPLIPTTRAGPKVLECQRQMVRSAQRYFRKCIKLGCKNVEYTAHSPSVNMLHRTVSFDDSTGQPVYKHWTIIKVTI